MSLAQIYPPLSSGAIASEIVRLKWIAQEQARKQEFLREERDTAVLQRQKNLIGAELITTREQLAETGHDILFCLTAYEKAGASLHDLCQLVGANHTLAKFTHDYACKVHKKDHLNFVSLIYFYELEDLQKRDAPGDNWVRMPLRMAIDSYLRRKIIADSLSEGLIQERIRQNDAKGYPRLRAVR